MGEGTPDRKASWPSRILIAVLLAAPCVGMLWVSTYSTPDPRLAGFPFFAAYLVPVPGQPGTHFGGSTAVVPFLGQKVYIALTAFVINVVVAGLLTVALRAAGTPAGENHTAASDYEAEAADRELVGQH